MLLLHKVKDLLEALPNINPDTIRDKYLRTPLHLACSRRDDPLVATSIAKLLIRAGSDVNNGVGDVDGLQPMHLGKEEKGKEVEVGVYKSFICSCSCWKLSMRFNVVTRRLVCCDLICHFNISRIILTD